MESNSESHYQVDTLSDLVDPTTPGALNVRVTAPGWRPAQARAHGWALVTAVQAGDQAAFAPLYSRYAPQVRVFIRGRAGAGVVEDLTSETFLNALRGIDSARDRGVDVLVWLLTIARNVVINHARRAWVRREVPTAQGYDHISMGGDPEEQVLATIDRDAIAIAVHDGVARLYPPQRDVVVMRDLHGRSEAETAQAVGRTPGAVAALRSRARRQLARDLAPDVPPGQGRYAVAVERARTAHAHRSRPPTPPQGTGGGGDDTIVETRAA